MSPFVHLCAHPGCTAWGGWGEGVDLLRGRPGTWWCAEHRPPRLDPARKRAAAADVPPAVQAARASGRLL